MTSDRNPKPQIVLLDGANGTELERRLGRLPGPLWTTAALLSHPATVVQVHRDYRIAGANVLTANTFRTHARNLAPAGLSSSARSLTKLAVDLARAAAAGVAQVAGSLAPLEDCYQPRCVPSVDELQREHGAAAEHLAAAGVDLILVETQSTVREAVAACRAAQATGLPTWLSFLCCADGALWSGESLADAATALDSRWPDAIGVNCLAAPDLLPVIRRIRSVFPGLPTLAYANTSRQTAHGWQPTSASAPGVYAELAREWIDAGVQIIGGCCGTTPEHIERLRCGLIA